MVDIKNIGYYLLLLFAISANVSIAGTSIAMYLALLFLIGAYIRGEGECFCHYKIIRAIAIFVACLTITSFFSYQPLHSLERVVTYSTRMIPFILVLYFIRNQQQVVSLTLLLGVSILIADGYAFFQTLKSAARPVGFSFNPIFFAGHLLEMGLLFLVLTAQNNCNRNIRMFYGIVAVITLCVLVLSGSRGAWIGFFIALIVAAIMNFTKNSKTKSGYKYLAIILFLGLLSVNIPMMSQKISNIFDMNYSTNVGRITLWKSAWNMFIDYPFTGVGLGEFGHFYKTQYILPMATNPNIDNPHNNIMHFLAETGIVGVAGFFYLFFTLIKELYNLYSARRNNPWIFAGVLIAIAFFVEGLFNVNVEETTVMRLFWFLMGIAYVADVELAERGYDS